MTIVKLEESRHKVIVVENRMLGLKAKGVAH
jgi:hypothetical protein